MSNNHDDNSRIIIRILINLLWLQTIVTVNSERKTRALTFPYNTATGILVAIAIPLNLPDHEVFMSYNFEANYGLPIDATDISQGVLKRFDLLKYLKNNGESADSDDERRSSKSLMTREMMYKMLRNKISAFGFNGKTCLLRAICDAADTPLREVNGVLGDIFHIILSPSASKKEKLNPEYYNAEMLGKSGDCKKYLKKCPKSVLDIISKIFHH